jgi:phosphate-selective porin
MLGVAFSFGDFATIVAPSTAETDELRQAIEAAWARSWFHAQAEALRQAAQAKVS